MLATVFFVCTLALAYMGHTPVQAPAAREGTSVLDRAVPAPAESGAPQIPGLAPPPAAASASAPAIPTN